MIRMQQTWMPAAVMALLAAAPLGAQEQAAAQAPARPTAQALLDSAIATAAKKNRRVLAEFRTDASERCKALDAALKKNRELSHEMLYEYVLVQLDGKEAGPLAANYGIPIESANTPALVILDAKGKLLTKVLADKLFGADGLDAKSLMELLTAQRCTPQDADALLAAAYADAKKTDRAVFIHFDAPW